ncbi:MAG: response regulator [Oscillospiraceae bacterium]|nr:response regulator [Oscillospiraceae bacterium]
MLDKERLLKVSEIDGDSIRQMNMSMLDTFTITADSLIDGFPALEENIKNALKADDRDSLTKYLLDLHDILRQVYAERLAESCLNQLNTIFSTEYDDLQAFVVYALKAVSALSIDLQMAGHKDMPKLYGGVSSEVSDDKKTILAVDDRHFFLNAIKNMLTGTGYKLVCISSGMSALNYLDNHKPDLFLLDIEMPEMDGYELARRIRASGQTAPIIFLTGNSKKEYVLKALQAGAADFIVKPVTKDQLLERIVKYIKPEETQVPDVSDTSDVSDEPDVNNLPDEPSVTNVTNEPNMPNEPDNESVES